MDAPRTDPVVEPVTAPDAAASGHHHADGGDSTFVETARGLWQDERVEIVAAILLALATVLSAWGAYQATRWSGEQADAYAESGALRAASGRQASIAARNVQVDVSTFLAWAQARATNDERLATFIETRFRNEFRVPFEAWLNEAPPDAEGLPSGTPFERADYQLEAQVQSDALAAQADAALAEARYDNQISDNFVLTAVLFASVLFFAGTAAKFRPQWIRWMMIGVAVVVFCMGIVIEFTLPQSIGF